ncbi:MULTISPECIES: hypothetical protein [Bartonella]|uniref:hypothetical protein n=1 Tax=Bartonella TaxID=773 RepID=UPI0018DB8E88|nr:MULTISPECIES: hypothetical protein [Bartonella]MBI0169759.1 hypothetical protein [Bartonella sp. W8167]MBI0174253.1 hypothetical protein [Bartonella apis]
MSDRSDPASVEKRRIKSRFLGLLIVAIILVMLLVAVTFVFFDITGIEALNSLA